MPSGKGQRLIVVHAGGVEGWVEGADLYYIHTTELFHGTVLEQFQELF